MTGRGNKKTSYLNVIKKWYVGVYTRRSFDDMEDTESNTITNQKNMITEYIKNDSNIVIVEYYVDDGYTGTNFDRPGFQDMLSDIKSGRINTIIVKDLSRLGRNYIEVGKYIEEVFPIYDLRIIAINDNVDSYLNPESINSLIIPIKNLMNENYSQDLSKKVSSAYETMAKKGLYVSGTSPYGYTFDPEEVAQKKGLKQMSDTSAIEAMVKQALDENPQAIEDFKNGKNKALGFLMGQVMKKSKGQANGSIVNKLIKEELQKRIDE